MIRLEDFHEEVQPGDLCHVCGKDAGGSLYWLAMSAEAWEVVRPFIAELFEDEDHIMASLYNADLCKALCHPPCVTQPLTRE